MSLPRISTLCYSCQLRFFKSHQNRLFHAQRNRLTSRATVIHTEPHLPFVGPKPKRRGFSIQRANRDESTLQTEPEYSGQADITPPRSSRSLHELEHAARAARNHFREALPDGYLTTEEFEVYKRMFGAPSSVISGEELARQLQEHDEATGPEDGTTLMQIGNDGKFEEIATDESLSGRETSAETMEEALFQMQEYEQPVLDVKEAEDYEEEEDHFAESEQDVWPGDDYVRTHPLTAAGRFGTSPSTIQIPKPSFTTPITEMLSKLPRKHLIEAAERSLGGSGLPYSPSTPRISRTMEQRPIGLSPHQEKMKDMDANVYLATVLPQNYSSIMSILVEVRKRLGTDWLQTLLAKAGGPLLLDVGAGGAGAIAWREVLRAEWASMHENFASVEKNDEHSLPSPVGKATVVVASDTLRHRVSKLLDNTSFIPRLPDFVDATEQSGFNQRKQYDLIIASHSLWPVKEDFNRKNVVQTLWSLLNPDGGVLIILEKGVPRGFEVVAGARDLLLSKHIRSPNDKTAIAELSSRQEKGRFVEKETGMIIAPCTNHVGCPLYKRPGVARGRKDWCYFRQRYIRPPFLQSILGAKARNHDDVEYSYVAVMRGKDLRETPQEGVWQGKEATEKAFIGYGDRADLMPVDDAPWQFIRETGGKQSPQKPDGPYLDTSPWMQDRIDSVAEEDTHVANGNGTQEQPGAEQPSAPYSVPQATDQKQAPHTLSLPRLLLNPIKRKGHILLDVCTPKGTLERWFVNRRCGKQIYRDARKAQWGDLWALGARSREERRIRAGVKDDAELLEGKKRAKDKMRRKSGCRDKKMRSDAEILEMDAGELIPEDDVCRR